MLVFCGHPGCLRKSFRCVVGATTTVIRSLEDEDWFTVLKARTRTIVYIHTDDILRRSVCEPLSERKIPVEPPLITTFYRKPATIRPCADRKYLLRSGGSPTRTRSHVQPPRVPRWPTLPRTRPFG